MDPTTLITAVLLAVGLLATDAVVYSGSVAVEVAPPPEMKTLAIDKSTLAVQFDDQLNEIARTASVVRPPEIRPSTDQGVGMALAEAANVQPVAFALQSSLGYNPDRLRLALYTQDGELRGMVSGSSHTTGSFHTVINPEKDEPLLKFVQRCAVWGASQLAPYATSLYLLEKHSPDGNFDDVVALAKHSINVLPPTPHNFDRSLFENVLGLVALFKNDKATARAEFDKATASDPTNPVPFLNAAFTDLQFDEYPKAVERMSQLIHLAPPTNKVLLSTAYMTLGAALMGDKKLKEADQMLAAATRINPDSSSAWDLWAEERQLQGDQAAFERMSETAKAANATFENYAEVASLYFHLSWQDNQPVTRSHFSNPTVLSFH